MRHEALPVHRSSPLLSSYLTGRWREPDSHPRSHPTALVAAHIRPCRIRLHRSRTLVYFRPVSPIGGGRRSSYSYCIPPPGVGDSTKLRATLSGWVNTFWILKDWYREG